MGHRGEIKNLLDQFIIRQVVTLLEQNDLKSLENNLHKLLLIWLLNFLECLHNTAGDLSKISLLSLSNTAQCLAKLCNKLKSFVHFLHILLLVVLWGQWSNEPVKFNKFWPISLEQSWFNTFFYDSKSVKCLCDLAWSEERPQPLGIGFDTQRIAHQLG